MTVEIEDFEIGEEIGRGGFGSVYRAKQLLLRRDVAIKVLRADVSEDQAIKRFERECQAIGGLSTHPNVVAVYGSGITNDSQPYLVMEYLPGGTLADRGKLPWQEAAAVGVGIASALTAAHQAGILHRDVKPQNVLFTEYGTAKLADFGIASMSDGFATQSGSMSVTLGYAAPEVLDGRPATARSDVYSLATSVLGAVLGHAPFFREADSTVALVARIATAPIPDCRLLGAPNGFAEVIERAMAKHPEDRMGSAEEFRTELAAAAGIELNGALTGSVPAVSVAAESVPAVSPETAATGEVLGGAPGNPLVASKPARRTWRLATAAVFIVLAGVVAAVVSGNDDPVVKVETASDRRVATSTSTTADVQVAGEVSVAPEAGVPVDSTDPNLSVPADSSGVGSGTPASGGSQGSAAIVGGGGSPLSQSTRASGGGGTTSGSTGSSPGAGAAGGSTSPPVIDPTSPPATSPAVTSPPVTNAPSTAAPTTGAPVNAAPLLPSASFEFNVPINENTVIVPAGDKRLSAGWSDPDGTASWLCLQFTPASQDFWLDGPNCEGSGLLVAATTVGTRTIRLKAMECSPGCGAPYSTGERIIRVNFFQP